MIFTEVFISLRLVKAKIFEVRLELINTLDEKGSLVKSIQWNSFKLNGKSLCLKVGKESWSEVTHSLNPFVTNQQSIQEMTR